MAFTANRKGQTFTFSCLTLEQFVLYSKLKLKHELAACIGVDNAWKLPFKII